jgi:hypothetical protein
VLLSVQRESVGEGEGRGERGEGRGRREEGERDVVLTRRHSQPGAQKQTTSAARPGAVSFYGSLSAS